MPGPDATGFPLFIPRHQVYSTGMSKNQTRTLLIILNTVFLLAVLVVNFLANALPIGGNTTKEVSDALPNYFTPAPFTFAVWGMIYLLLLLFTVYQIWVLIGRKVEGAGFLERIGPFFIISCLGDIGFIYAWHNMKPGLALIGSGIMFLSLAGCYIRLGIGSEKTSPREWAAVRLPFSLYFGWSSVALIANITAALVGAGFTGGGIPEPVWAMALIIIAGGVAAYVLLTRYDAAFTLVFSWAFAGIFAARLSAEGEKGVPALIAAAAVSLLLLLAAAYITVMRVQGNRENRIDNSELKR